MNGPALGGKGPVIPARRLLITGGTGFIGTHVVRQLRKSENGAPAPQLRLLIHRRPVDAHDDTMEIVPGDLSDPASLRGICDGVDTVVHLATRVGGDEASSRAVNNEGTKALLSEAARAGVGRIIQLGTTAVYRDGPHRGAAEGTLPEAPVSSTSISRLAGEKAVLAAGGTVLRPHMVYGDGDVWVIPALVDLMRRLPHWVDAGRTRVSLVSARELGEAFAALATLDALPRGQVLHANQTEPVQVRTLITTVARELRLPPPRSEITVAEALELLGAADDPIQARRLSLLTVDHWYDSRRLWELIGRRPGPGFPASFAAYAPWYRTVLSASR
jgi:2-alkyl-3-oxoalkanoate reductase